MCNGLHAVDWAQMNCPKKELWVGRLGSSNSSEAAPASVGGMPDGLNIAAWEKHGKVAAADGGCQPSKWCPRESGEGVGPVSPEPGAPFLPAYLTPSVSRELKNAEDPCADNTRIVQVHTH